MLAAQQLRLLFTTISYYVLVASHVPRIVSTLRVGYRISSSSYEYE